MTADGIVGALAEAGLARTSACEPLSKYTSWRVGGPADYFGVAEDIDALAGAIAVARRSGIPWIVLGGGSNVLVSDTGVEGLVILNRIKTARMGEGSDSGIFEGGGGLFFARAAQFTARRGFTGLEWGVAIPGTLGAGVVNNAGAHGGTVADTLVKAEVLTDEGHVTHVTPLDLAYRYRESSMKRRAGFVVTTSDRAVTRCWFRVRPCAIEESMEIIKLLMGRRQETQPIAEPSGGSTFKNPDSGSAGSLIEGAGLKGRREGGAEISGKHANFVVNMGGATAGDILQLMILAKRAVSDRLGVELEPEVQLVGRWAGDDRVEELNAKRVTEVR